MLHARPALSAALVVAIASLMLVGVESQTPVRHAIQVAPMVALLALHLAHRTWAPFAAIAVFAFWLLVMTMIWLFLLGIAHVITGHFSPSEVALTIVIAAASVVGLGAALRAREQPSWTTRLMTLVVAATVQVGAMWLSLQPSFAAR